MAICVIKDGTSLQRTHGAPFPFQALLPLLLLEGCFKQSPPPPNLALKGEISPSKKGIA